MEDWKRFIRDVLASGSTDFIGLLLHWHGGSVECEQIAVRQRRIIRPSELSSELLTHFSEDELYVFSR